VSTTPILDREQPLPKQKRSTWLSIGLGVVLGIVLIILDEYGMLPKVEVFPSRVTAPQLFIAFALSFCAVVLVHELGHVMAAFASGFEIRGVNVGAFVLTKEARRWRLRIVPRRIFAGGLVGIVPRSDENLRGRFIRFALGGPVATALLLVVLLLLPGGFTWKMLLAVNLLAASGSFIPYTAMGQPTDAKTVLILARKGPTSERLAAILYLLALDRQGVQPGEWPGEYVEKIGVTTRDTSNRPSCLSLQYARASETNDPDSIASVLESALAASHKMRPDAQRRFFVAASCFHGIIRKNPALAEAWLEGARKVKGAVPQKDWDSKAQAGICFANGQHSEAREQLTRYVALLDRLPVSGMVAAERTRTLALVKQVEAAV
jgi:hypothetical protein